MGPPQQKPAPDDSALQAFSARAYRTDLSVRTEEKRDTLATPEGEVAIDFIAPREVSKAPLVIYLPGLGESVTDASEWRYNWASAGYAVLTIQALSDGQNVLMSEAARAGAFRELALKAISLDERERRMRMVQHLLKTLAEQATSEALYRTADLDHILIAGFDMGAFTALGFATAQSAILPGLRGIIAIRPYHDRHAVDAQDYARVSLPVLSVTSVDDVDEFGLIADPSARGVPYQNMPRGDKFMLVMRTLSHRNLSGKQNFESFAGPEQTGKGMGDRRMPFGGAGGDGGGMPGGGGSPGGRGGPGENRPRGGIGPGSSPTDTGQAFIVIRSVMLAFTDSVLRDNAVAQDWLMLDAPRWLRPLGTLSAK